MSTKNSPGSPVIKIRAETLPEAWEKSLLECWEKGIQVRTEYDKPEDPPSRDCTIIIEVISPFKEPRLHRAIPAGLADLEIYCQEVLLGVHDEWIKPEEGKWEYTYHERLFNYKVEGRSINQIESVVHKLCEIPYTRRAQAVTWKVWEDTDIHDPACFTAGTQIATPNGYVRVEEIKDGSEVYSYDFTLDRVVKSVARKCFSKMAKNLGAFTLSNGDAITVTDEHRMWCKDRDGSIGWRRAKDVTQDVRLLSVTRALKAGGTGGGGAWTKVDNIDQFLDEALVYDFEVDHPDHSIISDNIVTHNCLQRCWFRIFGENLQLNVHLRSNDAFKAAFMNMFAFTELQKMVAEKIGQATGKKIKVGKYVHIADSYHIYGSYDNDFHGCLDTMEKRSFEERTWPTSFAEPFFEEGRKRLEKEKRAEEK